MNVGVEERFDNHIQVCTACIHVYQSYLYLLICTCMYSEWLIFIMVIELILGELLCSYEENRDTPPVVWTALPYSGTP